MYNIPGGSMCMTEQLKALGRTLLLKNSLIDVMACHMLLIFECTSALQKLPKILLLKIGIASQEF